MCAQSEGKLRDAEVDVYMGYFGGSLKFGNFSYSNHPEEQEGTRQGLIDKLKEYSAEELSVLIADFLDNAEER